MNDSNNGISGDGRLTVLLFLMLGLLLFDFTYRQNWSIFYGNSGCNLGEKLSFVHPDKLVVGSYSDVGKLPTNKPVPAIFSPFFFALIPINRADKDMLMSVQGIGPALADTIVEYRRKLGPFKKSIDLQNLKGIGRKRAEKFSKVFTFDEEP